MAETAMKLLAGLVLVPWLTVGVTLAMLVPVPLRRRLFGIVAWPYIPAWVAWREHLRRSRKKKRPVP